MGTLQHLLGLGFYERIVLALDLAGDSLTHTLKVLDRACLPDTPNQPRNGLSCYKEKADTNTNIKEIFFSLNVLFYIMYKFLNEAIFQGLSCHRIVLKSSILIQDANHNLFLRP